MTLQPLTFSNNLALKPSSTRGKLSFFLCFLCWQTALMLSSPPAFQLVGRFSLEPAGTGCTLDYWHGGFANYVPYVFATIAYILR